MKKIILAVFIISTILFSHCSKYKVNKLSPHTKFHLTIGNKKDDVKIINISDYFFETPSEYFIKNRTLFLIDSFNYRILKVDKKNNISSIFGEMFPENKLDKLNITASNSSELPFDSDLFKFVEPGQIYIDRNNSILVENILSSINEEHKYNAYSLILKFDENGKPLEIYGEYVSSENRIYPFKYLDHFSVDTHNNLFVFEKIDNNWIVFKFETPQKRLNQILTSSIIEKISKPNENDNLVIENIDHNSTGDFLIAGINFYNKDYKFSKTVFYRINFSGTFSQLFTIKDEDYNFFLVNNSDIIYLWKTVEQDNGEEKIILALINLRGEIIEKEKIELKRDGNKWFNIKIEKDDTISGIQIKNKELNIVSWE